MKFEWRVARHEVGKSISEFLEIRLKDKEFSKKKIKGFIDAGFCKINGSIQCFSRTKLSLDSKVQLQIPVITREPLAILYQDTDILILNKPAGTSCDERLEKTLVDMGHKAFLVHRLDKDTTGVLLVAKSVAIRDTLMQAFQERTVEKTYVAIVDKAMDPEGFIENYLGPIARSSGQVKWGVVKRGGGEAGHLAATTWECKCLTAYASLVMLYPKTGRTHQLRVHLSSIGHPILGDKLYGTRFHCNYLAPRQLLHAKKLKFMHPTTGSVIEVEAPIPSDMQKAIDTLFGGVACAF